MNLRVTTSGVVRVSASPRVPLGLIEAFICRHRAFVEKALQNRKSRGGHPMVPDLDTEIMVMGKMYRVVLEKPHTVSTYAVTVANDTMLVRYPSDYEALDASKVERMWLNFWKTIGQDFMETLAQQVYSEFQRAGYTVPIPTVRLRYMTSRWGSCTPLKEIITMNTRLLLGPTEFAHYVMVHEFAHFIEPNHSSRFYKVMSDVLPNWEQVKAEMKAYYT